MKRILLSACFVLLMSNLWLNQAALSQSPESATLVLIDASDSTGSSDAIASVLAVEGGPLEGSPFEISAWRALGLETYIALFNEPGGNGMHVTRDAGHPGSIGPLGPNGDLYLDTSDFDSYLRSLAETYGTTPRLFSAAEMPRALSLHPDSLDFATYAPASDAEWDAVMQAAVRHLCDANGICSPIIQVSSEPETENWFWNGRNRSDSRSEKKDAYVDFFIVTWYAVEAAEKPGFDARTIGPGSAVYSSALARVISGIPDVWGMEEFLAGLHEHNLAHSDNPIDLEVVGWQGYDWTGSRRIRDGVTFVQDELERNGFSRDTPQIIIGWNAEWTQPRIPLWYEASHIASNVIDLLNVGEAPLVEKMYYYTWNLDGEPCGVPDERKFSSLITTINPEYEIGSGECIPASDVESLRPSYAAFQALHSMLGGEFVQTTVSQLPGAVIDAMATRHPAGAGRTIKVLLANNSDADVPASLRIANVPWRPGTRVNVMRQQIDDSHSVDGGGLEGAALLAQLQVAADQSLTITTEVAGSLRTRSVWLLAIIPHSGIAYYVSPSGSDANSGTSPDQAWQTIERVNAGNYQPGDSILFEGGQTFDGSLQFSAENAHGNLQSPVTISSFGEGRATLSGGGFAAANAAGFAIENINFKGNSPQSAAGINLLNQSPATLSGLRVVNVEISGFAYAILAITGAIPSKIQDIHLERVSAHDNAAGPSFFGYLTQSGAVNGHYGIGNVYIGDSEFFNHTGWGQYNLGNGLTLMNAENVTIERNAIHDNGGDNLPPGEDPNGPSAITVYDGHNITIQHNEIYHQRVDPDGPTDNAGIDLWATDSVVQYNYVHDNEGWGMTLGAGDPNDPNEVFPWPSERLTIRYNIFENNARRLPNSTGIPELLGAQLLMFGPIKDFEIYNNTFYSRNPAAPVPDEQTQGMISIYATPPARDPQGLRFRNNIFIAEDQVRFIETTATVGNIFTNNAYIGGAAAKQVTWGWQTYFDTIADWSAATGQEQVDGAFAARLAAPTALCAPGAGRADGCRLSPNSPLRDVGLDLVARYGLEVGTQDFFGNPIPTGAGYDVGAHEFQPGQTCLPTAVENQHNSPELPAEFELAQNYPNPFNPETTIKYELPKQAKVKLDIYDLMGKHVRTLVQQDQPAGRYTITCDGRNEQGEAIASGVYLYQLRVGDPSAGSGRGFVQTRKMALLR